MSKPVAALILAAGRGERMNSDLVKVLHPVAGLPLLGHVIETVQGANIRNIGVVVGGHDRTPRSFLNGAKIVVQKNRLGTGHAVMQARRQFGSWRGDLLVLPGDAPCVRAETLQAFMRMHQRSSAHASILTAEFENPAGYGRVLRRGMNVVGIKEDLDLAPAERRVKEINSGIYLFDAPTLFRRLLDIQKNRNKKEYYLTDIIELLVRSGESVRGHKLKDSKEILGVNTRRELAAANQVLSERELERHSKAGVTILNPAQTSIQKGVTIGRDTVIHPFTWIERGVVIGAKCEIGPFAKIRSGTKIRDHVVIGSFVEIVRSQVGHKTFVKHLSYLGDAEIGRNVNVGAGTMTANFDGKRKHKTVVREGALLGCNTVLVAPVTVGKRAKTGAGAVVCAGHSVPAGKTVVGIPAKVVQKSKKG